MKLIFSIDNRHQQFFLSFSYSMSLSGKNIPMTDALANLFLISRKKTREM